MGPKIAWSGEIQEDYEVLRPLGSGKFAEVYEVKSKSSKSLGVRPSKSYYKTI